ncbi:MAG: metallophosphoesterase family protein [Anaerolineae bacterium]|nr:metallophosphoesterase family protein [Anaerolineae bacterium]
MRHTILSDIHGNLQALEAVLADAPPDAPLWCLGDIVGYGPNPNECIERLRSLDVECIVGNHDWAVMNKVDVQDFNPDAQLSVRWTQDQLSPESTEYLESLPVRLENGPFTLVHGSPREPIWEYILYPPTARLNFAHFDTPYCFVGHTHVPVLFRLHHRSDKAVCEAEQLLEGDPRLLGDGRLIVNPGSVGQPRDGDARASYAILDAEEASIEYRRVAYDITQVQRLMEEADLPRRNIMRLSYGW